MNSFEKRGFAGVPPVIKNLILINAILFLLTVVLEGSFGFDLGKFLSLYHIKSEFFRPFQFVTHMFMHANLSHIFFNMFALWMFGRVLEGVWGPKRFFMYYLITGLGAALVHMFVLYIQYVSLEARMSPEQIEIVVSEGSRILAQSKNYVDPLMADLNMMLNVRTVGASGAVFGVLLAFGMLFPNTQLMLLFPPIPIKAKYVAILALFLGILLDYQGNVAHFAHLGGMVFGFFLIKYWNKNRKIFY